MYRPLALALSLLLLPISADAAGWSLIDAGGQEHHVDCLDEVVESLLVDDAVVMLKWDDETHQQVLAELDVEAAYEELKWSFSEFFADPSRVDALSALVDVDAVHGTHWLDGLIDPGAVDDAMLVPLMPTSPWVPSGLLVDGLPTDEPLSVSQLESLAKDPGAMFAVVGSMPDADLAPMEPGELLALVSSMHQIAPHIVTWDAVIDAFLIDISNTQTNEFTAQVTGGNIG